MGQSRPLLSIFVFKTVDFWCRKRPLCQLSHNRCPCTYLLPCIFAFHFWSTAITTCDQKRLFILPKNCFSISNERARQKMLRLAFRENKNVMQHLNRKLHFNQNNQNNNNKNNNNANSNKDDGLIGSSGTDRNDWKNAVFEKNYLATIIIFFFLQLFSFVTSEYWN